MVGASRSAGAWVDDDAAVQAEPVRAEREDGGQAGQPEIPRGPVGGEESLAALDRLDARPLVQGREARAGLPSWLVRGGSVGWSLVQDLAAAHDLPTVRPALRRGCALDSGDPLAKQAAPLVVRELPERRRSDALDRYDFRQITVLAEETRWAAGAQGATVEVRTQRRGARPLVSSLDQVILHRIAERVCQLGQNIIGLEQFYDGGGLAGPEVLRAPVKPAS
jgi:hypothetical protein